MTDTKCPYCSSAVKYPSRPRNQYRHDTSMTSTHFACGTVTSESWSPPLRDLCCDTISQLPKHQRQEVLSKLQLVCRFNRPRLRSESPQQIEACLSLVELGIAYRNGDTFKLGARR